MKFQTMQQVYIQSDVLNVEAPIGEIGYVVDIDRDSDRAQRYCIRVPSQKKWFWMPECDLCSAEEWLDVAASMAIEGALVERALDTKDEEGFRAAVQWRRGCR
ncbi:hypothetical protein AAC03nite_20300 [Alicyclobacillus acidoterrestris]|uniref:hypothetical protein n=1 Tax=Alicyclobacillus suci TaxID=2816080 RepID=UPI0011955789|nr:hypothetical protein [Alicyclobacillus suci]GEO26245.1 hypothetical protein AAC03nite_20300 [Alicyclobacillus acidoterrestris]